MSSGTKAPTAVLMMNMGGPSSLDGERDGVKAFLSRLFADGEIIQFGAFQNILVRPIPYAQSLVGT